MVAIEHRQKSSTAATATATATSSATINIAVLSPTSSASSASAASNTTTTTTSSIQQQQQQQKEEQQQPQQQLQQVEKKQLVDVGEEENKEEEEEEKGVGKIVKEILKSNQKSLKMSQLDSPAELKTSESKQLKVTSTAGAVSKSAVSQRNVDIKLAKKSNLDAATTKELTKKVLKLDLTGKELDELSIKSPKSPIARLPHQTSLTSSVDVEDRKTLREALYQGIFHRHRRTIFAVGSFLRMLRSRNSQYNTIRSSSEGEEVEEVVR